VCDGSNSRSDGDSLESTDLGIGTNGSPKWDDICLIVSLGPVSGNMGAYEESEHLHDAGSGDGTHTESSGRLVETGGTGCNSTSSVTTLGKRSIDEIVEWSNGTVV
jgi:hypothetical protein